MFLLKILFHYDHQLLHTFIKTKDFTHLIPDFNREFKKCYLIPALLCEEIQNTKKVRLGGFMCCKLILVELIDSYNLHFQTYRNATLNVLVCTMCVYTCYHLAKKIYLKIPR